MPVLLSGRALGIDSISSFEYKINKRTNKSGFGCKDPHNNGVCAFQWPGVVLLVIV